MPDLLRIILIVGSILFLIFLIISIKKSKLSNDIATLWIIFSLIILVLAIFPEIIVVIVKGLGIDSPVNGVYLIFIALLLALSFVLFAKVSTLENKLNDLAQKVGIKNHNEGK